MIFRAPSGRPSASRVIVVVVALAAGLLGAGQVVSCAGSSSLRIRVVFPDATARSQAARLTLFAVDPGLAADGSPLAKPHSCSTARGHTAALLGKAVVGSADVKLTRTTVDGDPQLPGVPLQRLLITALVYDAQGALTLAGCSAVDAKPGDNLELTIHLNCAPGRTPCWDLDGDGVPADRDCDDEDPCRSPSIKESATSCNGPYPPLPPACLAKLAKEGRTMTAPYCGDGIDQDCDGADLACAVDADCDGSSPPQDCDDQDPSVYPGAVEVCDGKDNNCNGAVDEGCVCDVDGDGHAAKGPVIAGCAAPPDDPDDYDAGVYPGSTAKTGNKEGASVLTALRQWCSRDVRLDKNGLRPRDVDHDGDGRPASADCPPESCDNDGDGFPGPQCNPPKSIEDCDDNDPYTFPGAPDRCGDGKAQNCNADAACSCDKDGDGYCPPDDCDDTNPRIHPWAPELCNGKDDDCDGLIDEGNPAAVAPPATPPPPGTPPELLRTSTPQCSDNASGRCGKNVSGNPNDPAKWLPATGSGPSGVCACGKADPKGKLNPGSRIACKNESQTPGAYAPRCFGATQPLIERCDANDWNCDGHSISPAETEFIDFGKPCGINVGNCKAGTVTGCDLAASRPMPVFGASYNPHWTCSPGTVYPAAEKCNGKDDDCDGNVPANEVDKDKDGFLPCSGCTPTDLVVGLKGCGDCDDGNAQTYPGAAELCNNVDDNCLNTLADDGASVCPALGQVCCSTQKACRDTSTDIFNCGGCGTTCDAALADRCASKVCVCGQTGGPCGAGLDCVSGQCRCITNGRCPGCCEGDVCQPGGASDITRCGVNGATCKSCDDGKECTSEACSGGVCSNPNKTSGIACQGTAGRCYAGACCTGCWNGSICHPPPATNTYCGTGGAICLAGGCTTTSPCETADCGTGSCVNSPKATGTACPGGKCASATSTCCTGCLLMNSCELGSASNLCGAGGNDCADCTTNGRSCLAGACGCPSGKCMSGASCVAGTASNACGSSGACVDCTLSAMTCISQICQ